MKIKANRINGASIWETDVEFEPGDFNGGRGGGDEARLARRFSFFSGDVAVGRLLGGDGATITTHLELLLNQLPHFGLGSVPVSTALGVVLSLSVQSHRNRRRIHLKRAFALFKNYSRVSKDWFLNRLLREKRSWKDELWEAESKTRTILHLDQ